VLETLYFVKFPDGGVYCPNVLGPIGFETEKMAQELADAIDGGYVVARSKDYVIAWCNDKNAALFVSLANGKVFYSEDAVSLEQAQPDTVRVEGVERGQILQVRNVQMQR
jgi:hypothetical protein